ncbi:MAG: CDP-glycerol glycerophosphotransferase family protein [Gammaproteobacteria bacterium]
MITLNRLKAKVEEQFFINHKLRAISGAIYRKIFYHEKNELDNYRLQYAAKSIIAINVGHVYFLEHIREFVDSLNSDKKIAPLLIGTSKWPVKKYKIELFKFLKDRYNISYGKNYFAYPWAKFANAKALFEVAVSSYGSELKCPKIIYAHGMAGLNFSKDYRHVRFLEKYSAVLLNGPLHKKALITAQRMYGSKLPPMFEIGYLKGDRLLKKSESFNKTQFLDQLALPHVPTIMYAPTWGEFSSTNEWLYKIIDVCESMGLNLLLRLHPIMLTGKSKWYTGGVNWGEALSKIEKTTHQVRVVLGHDLDNIMLVSDIMITDVSGMALDFMILDRPVLFLPAPEYFRIYGSDRPEKWCRPDCEINSRSELKQEIIRAIDGNSYKCPVDKLVYNQGKSLQTMIDTVKGVLENDKNAAH